jgi:hypothetical protein
MFTQAKTEAQVLLEREGLAQDRVWVVHKGGFCLGMVVRDSPKRASALSTHVSLFKVQVRGEREGEGGGKRGGRRGRRGEERGAVGGREFVYIGNAVLLCVDV